MEKRPERANDLVEYIWYPHFDSIGAQNMALAVSLQQE